MNQLKTTHANVEWEEEGETVNIRINLSGNNQLAVFLKDTFASTEKPKLATKDYTCTNCLFVRNGSKFDKIKHGDILYLEAHGAYTEIHTRLKNYTIARNLTRCSRDLVFPFLRVHRSFTININNIDSFSDANVFYGEKCIPVSESNRKDLQTYFNRI